ncbi:MAG: VanZ family protein [Lachnospiraceae bacterium]|nr:VanZ family protein [Lachnospiraceae bacterium]
MNRKEILKLRMTSNVAGILAVLWMAVIFGFSAQPKEESGMVSEEVSERLLNVTGWFFHLNIDEERVHEAARALERYVRKGAHMTEFAVLAVLLYLWIGRWRMSRLRQYGIAVMLAILYAGSDEFHQLFVEGRAGLVSDVVVDGTGAVLGLALFILLPLCTAKIMREGRRIRLRLLTSGRDL